MPKLKRFPTRKVVRKWTAEELVDVLQFLQDHEDASWKTKEQLWREKHGVRRTSESLRGKMNYLIRLQEEDNNAHHTPLPRASRATESLERSDFANLGNQPTSTAARAEIAESRHDRGNHLTHRLPDHGGDDDLCRVLPSISETIGFFPSPPQSGSFRFETRPALEVAHARNPQVLDMQFDGDMQFDSEQHFPSSGFSCC
jgi:hypothetical protein